MKDFLGRVAVVTGAASGIGRAIVDRCVAERMKVVMADVEVAALERAAEELRGAGAQVLAVPTDVSDASQVDALAERASEAFGSIHLLFNNAGVNAPDANLWEYTASDCNWVFGVNLWGVLHGIRSFVPRMMRHGEEGRIVNTSSMAGVLSTPYAGIYAASKHAVVSLSETLAMELHSARSRIGVSVLCPSWVRTGISDAERNRPAALANDPQRPENIDAQVVSRWKRRSIERGTSPAEIANKVFDAIAAKKLYVITHEEWLPTIARKWEEIVKGENPSHGLPPLELLQDLARARKSRRS